MADVVVKDAPPPAPAPRSWTTRLGEACVLAVGVAAFSSVPTALRTAGAGGSFLDGLLVGTGVLLPLVAASLALFRAAGRGLRGVLGASSRRVATLHIALWLGFSLPLLAGLGAVLKATTNHRGLGGATFGVLALGAVLTAALVARRVVAFGQHLADRGVRPWVLAAAGAVVTVLPLVAFAAPLARAGAGGSARHIQAALLDGGIALVATALVASVDLAAPLARVAGTWGVPLAAVLIFGATARVESSPGLGRAVRTGGGLAASLLGALEGWTDRDGDGMGAHFGGHDCDEGDPARHPGAAERPGDGVDQDCDGADPPRAALADTLPSSETVPASAVAQKPAPSPPAAAAPSVSAAPSGEPAIANTSVNAAAAPAAPTAAALAAAPSGPVERPDIYLITLDTVRADHTSVHGYRRPTTPNLAKIAERGVVFERAYAVGSDTQRTLMPLVSGKRFSRTARDHREWPTIQAENDTLAERLKRAGYVTAAVTSFTWLTEERGFAQGFDRFEAVYDKAHPERDVTGEHAIKAALGILKELDNRAQPIFFWLHLFDAHEKYLEHPGISFGKGKMALYDGELAFVDKQLGALMDAIEKGSRRSRAAFIVHGSQGEGFAEHDFVGHGGELYEEVLRIPLVVALPGPGPKGARYDKGVVSAIDIGPTVLALGGAPLEEIEGESLLPIARGELEKPRGPVYARSARRAALIDGSLKLMVIERKRRDRLLLFDLAADPGETKDLSAERPEDLARLTQLRATFEPPEK
jgi:arylsulfatase A-like enzyme